MFAFRSETGTQTEVFKHGNKLLIRIYSGDVTGNRKQINACMIDPLELMQVVKVYRSMKS